MKASAGASNKQLEPPGGEQTGHQRPQRPRITHEMISEENENAGKNLMF